ncbi:MAG: hypothetical protein J6L73_06315, partial [Muribaculaceae bacterium]|nr:hypothetical protein [Muribaculaceae bacterium]
LVYFTRLVLLLSVASLSMFSFRCPGSCRVSRFASAKLRPFSELTKYFREKITEKLQPYHQYSVNHINTEVLKYVKTNTAIELFVHTHRKKMFRQPRLNPMTPRSRRTLASKKTQKTSEIQKKRRRLPRPALFRLHHDCRQIKHARPHKRTRMVGESIFRGD